MSSAKVCFRMSEGHGDWVHNWRATGPLGKLQIQQNSSKLEKQLEKGVLNNFISFQSETYMAKIGLS